MGISSYVDAFLENLDCSNNFERLNLSLFVLIRNIALWLFFLVVNGLIAGILIQSFLFTE